MLSKALRMVDNVVIDLQLAMTAGSPEFGTKDFSIQEVNSLDLWNRSHKFLEREKCNDITKD